ncbi:hypothetical protein ASD11_06960 [Aeromicrobium sp. Root495]|uniref:AGE family epimerase/isomerase n=1 Tax=Aeromicrobium sp. Root495 TaxID=1736550 RepID=UPI0006F7B748|nr:AGE family epimerase/isomerase [Aeromicrobium sp. Root495]KQY59308.1 hypothetical protein ASD11_06960 [Aeromicrobium sp. Root495]RYJ07546.1 MAG: AGE family epimerase/isomerase [Actinomycetales bacterium]
MADLPGGASWRETRRRELLTFARRSVRPEGGFVWLDASGRPEPGKGLELWINARMTYVFALSALLGESDDLRLADHGVRTLRTLLHDDDHGGWFDAAGLDGSVPDTTKRCYGHAHVVMAAATAASAGAEGGQELLAEALEVHGTRFWDDTAGRCREELSRDWSLVDPYRGANSNMHTVEAYQIAADVTGDQVWRDRALSICAGIIDRNAREQGWRIPEHFDAAWVPLPGYNEDRPADPFRPYGATPGHAFEWSRLLLQQAAGMLEPPVWIEEAAEALFQQAVADAVEPDRAGLVYTTDWAGLPSVRERFHWVMGEAVLAAEALSSRTNRPGHAAWARRWWSEIDEHFIDDANGSWRHELSPDLAPSSRTWTGRPDAYHAFNALTLPGLPLFPSPSAAAGDARPRGQEPGR